MNYYKATVTMTREYVIKARSRDEAEDKAFLSAWDVLPVGYEVSDVKIDDDEEGWS